VEEAAHPGAQLPHFVRGVFHEGFRPAAMPAPERTRAAFLDTLRAEAPEGVSPEAMADALFTAPKTHCDPGELAHVRQVLPGPVAGLMDAA
jgi:uncharacterized protein (DUF2267 family)